MESKCVLIGATGFIEEESLIKVRQKCRNVGTSVYRKVNVVEGVCTSTLLIVSFFSIK